MKRPVAKLATLILPLTISLTLSLTLIAGYAGVASAASGKCNIAVKGASPTARACAKGGRDDAKKVMKQMMAAANANGGKFSCEGCHNDLETFALRANAVEDYKKLQAASGMK